MSESFSNDSTLEKNSTERSMSETVIPTASTDLTICAKAVFHAPASTFTNTNTLTNFLMPVASCLLPVGFILPPDLPHPLNQMVPHPERVGHDGESWVHRAARTENAAIDDIEIVHVVRFAVGVQRAGFRIVAKANRTHLMRHACQGNSLTDVQVPSEQSLVALVAVNLALGLLLHQFFQPCYEPFVALFVVGPVAKDDASVGVECNAILGIRQILGCKQEVQGMFCHQIQRPAGC